MTYEVLVNIDLPAAGEILTVQLVLAPEDYVGLGHAGAKRLGDCTLAELQRYASSIEADVWSAYADVQLDALAQLSEVKLAVSVLNEDGPRAEPFAGMLDHIVVPTALTELGIAADAALDSGQESASKPEEPVEPDGPTPPLATVEEKVIEPLFVPEQIPDEDPAATVSAAHQATDSTRSDSESDVGAEAGGPLSDSAEEGPDVEPLSGADETSADTADGSTGAQPSAEEAPEEAEVHAAGPASSTEATSVESVARDVALAEPEPEILVSEPEPAIVEREAPAVPVPAPPPGRIRILGRRRPVGHPTWTAVDVLINEPAFRDAQAHAVSSPDKEVAGVLVGPPPEKQPDNRYLVHVSDIIIAEHTRMAGASVTYTPESWRYVNDMLAERYPHGDAVIVGWYHTHPGFGIFLSGMDQFIHQNFFTQIWHVALVLDPRSKQTGFFCWDRHMTRVDRYEFPWPWWARHSW